MKKFIALIMALCLITPVAVHADIAKELAKKQNKEYKAKLKEYKKDGWKVYGSSHTIDVALLKHYDKLNQLGDDGREVMGEATNCKSRNIGHQMAINNACTTYAQQAGSTLKGRVVSDMGADGTNLDAEFDHFYAAYERQIEKEIRGEMTESFSLIKERPDGTCSIQTYFIVSESAATAARVRAYENALKESEAAQRYADKISEFVRDGFNQ